MAENEQDLLTYARKIRKYCQSRTCEIDCVFFRHIEHDCGLDGFSPDYWSIPKKNRRANDGRE